MSPATPEFCTPNSNEDELVYDPDAGMSPRVFLSCVSAEFKPHRLNLAKGLTGQEVTPITQEQFRCGDAELLGYLHDAVRESAIIVHLIGNLAGSKSPPKVSVDEVLKPLKAFLQEPYPDFYKLTYTQWEAVFALAYRKPLKIFLHSGTKLVVDRDAPIPKGPLASQQRHLCWLLKHDKHIGGGFSSPPKLRELAIRIICQDLADAKARHQQAKAKRDGLLTLFAAASPRHRTERELDGRNQRGTHFYGREWLYAEIVKWLRTSDDAVYWLQADAGFGKSSFCAKLAMGWNSKTEVKVAAQVFCKPGTGPFEVLREICRQLRQSIPAYAKKFDIAWKSLAWHKIDIPESFDQEGEAQDKLVDQLIGPPLIEPLTHENSASTLKRLVVIDGLDEVLQRSDNPLKKLFQHLLKARLPSIRLLVTSRPARMYPQLEVLFGSKHRVPTQKEMDKDASEFIDQELGKVSPGWRAKKVVTQLLAKSKSSMLYLHYLALEIRDGNYSADRVADVPSGLGRYYLRKLDKEYFDGTDEYTTFETVVRPCLEAVAAGESTDISVADLEQCFGADAIKLVRSAMHAMILERPHRAEASFLVERTQKVDGEYKTILAPFHLSFMDWLLGRKFDGSGATDAAGAHHKFRIYAQEGDRTLAKWAWREFEQQQQTDASDVPNPRAYWIREGVDHLLRTFNHLHRGTWKPAASSDPLEQYTYLVHAVDFLGWLKPHSTSESIVSRSLSLLSRALALTTQDEGKLTSKVLAELEKVNQLTLFNLIKDICSTDLTDDIVWWIGRTQLDEERWKELVREMLRLDEFVVRCAAGGGQAARYLRLMTDSALGAAHRKLAVEEINKLLESTEVNRQEMGSYAVGEIAKEEFPHRIPPQVVKWLQQFATRKLDFYFCQSVLGDVLIDLSLSECHEQVEQLDQLGAIDVFWQPIWQYTRQDVIRVLSLRALEGRTLPRNLRAFQAEVNQQLEAVKARNKSIKAFQKSAGKLGPKLAKILQQPELDDADDALIIEWLTREDVELEVRINTAVELLMLMFTHMAWRVCEKGSAVLAALEAHTNNRDLCLAILDRLLESLATLPPERGRVILGAAEACYLSRHFDSGKEFAPGEPPMLRIAKCIHTYFDDDNCDTRGLLVENVAFLITEKEHGKSGWEKGRSLKLLKEYKTEIEYWLLDTDIWVLEHIYQAFRLIDDNQAGDMALQLWTKDRLAHVDKHPDCLLAAITNASGKPWNKLPRATFLRTAQRVQRARLGLKPLTGP